MIVFFILIFGRLDLQNYEIALGTGSRAHAKTLADTFLPHMRSLRLL